MTTEQRSLNSGRANKCQRCGGAFVRDQDGDFTCLICGRPARSRRWEPSTRDETPVVA